MAGSKSPSTWWLSLLFPLLFLVPAIVAVHLLPDPGRTFLGTTLEEEEFRSWEASDITLDIVNTGNDVRYFYFCDVIGLGGTTYVSQSQSIGFLPGGVAITGQMSTHTNQQNQTPASPFPCNNPSTPLVFSDVMEFRFKTGSDLTSFVSGEPTFLNFSYDFSTFVGNPLRVAIVAWSVNGGTPATSLITQEALRQAFWQGGPANVGPFAPIHEVVINDFGAIPNVGSFSYQFTGADLIVMGAISTRALAGISIAFSWDGAANRVGNPTNTFDFDATIDHVKETVVLIDTTPAGQANTVDRFGSFLVLYGIFMIFMDIFALEVISVKSILAMKGSQHSSGHRPKKKRSTKKGRGGS